MLANLEFLTGLAMRLADSTAIDGFLHVQEKLGEMVIELELFRNVNFGVRYIHRSLASILEDWQASPVVAFDLGCPGTEAGVQTLIGVVAGVLIMAGFYQDWFPIVLAYVAVIGIASYGVLTRRRWGWLFHIPLSLNPGLWAFNSVYANNRWRELPWR